MRALSYVDALREGFPSVIFRYDGDPYNYDNLDWEGGDALPSQDDLNTWILENPPLDPATTLTKYEFRKLFKFEEKVAIDNIASNTTIPEQYKQMIITMNKDLDVSGVIILTNPDITAGLGLLTSIGLLAPGRAAQILSRTPPN